MTPLQHYWLQLSSRDKTTLLLGLVIVLPLLVYALLWEPFTQRLAHLEQRVSQQRSDVLWMQHAEREAHALKTSSPASQPATHGSLLTLSDASSKRHQLNESVKRVQPDGAHSVRIYLEEADFSDLLRWLDELTLQHQILLTALSIEGNKDTPGRVNARVVLESPA